MINDEKLNYRFSKLRNVLVSNKKFGKLSSKVISELENSYIFNKGKTICVYSCANHVSLSPILLNISSYLKNTFVFPKLIDKNLSYNFVSNPNDLIIKGSEVVGSDLSCFKVDNDSIDVILVPGIAFDYDNNWMNNEEELLYTAIMKSNAIKIGICLDCQIYRKQLPNKMNKVDALLTENGVFNSFDIWETK